MALPRPPRGVPGVSEFLLLQEQNGVGDEAQVVLPSELNIRARQAVQNRVTARKLPRIGGDPPTFGNWTLPGEGIHPLDAITILGVQLPLAKSIEGAMTLDLDKRKEPGSDYSSYVSQGKDSDPIRITIQLFRDTATGMNWWENFTEVKDRLIAAKASKRDAVPVFHPILKYLGIESILFIKVGFPKKVRGQIWEVDLEGRDIRFTRLGGGGSGGKSKVVEQAKGVQSRSESAAPQAKKNVVYGPPKPGGIKRT